MYLGRGNRDFLIGGELAEAVGARLLPDPAMLQTGFGPVLLSHGDEYCTDDAAYQQFRAMVRNPQWQAQFLALSIPGAIEESPARRAARAWPPTRPSPWRSWTSTRARWSRPSATAARRVMVHGHTHRPARHVLAVDGTRRERWVLPDWDCDHVQPPRGGWLVIDRDGPQYYDLESA